MTRTFQRPPSRLRNVANATQESLASSTTMDDIDERQGLMSAHESSLEQASPPSYHSRDYGDDPGDDDDGDDGKDVADGDAAGLSRHERKCLLINAEIDKHGMGKYQWYVWTLCGFGYMLDLLWAQAFGFVLSPVQQEFGFGNDKTGNISIAFSVGLTTGAFFWGFVADTIGRQWAFNLTVLFASVFGILLGLPDTYAPFLLLVVLVGFGIGGNIPIDTTIVLEFIPQNRRSLLALLSVFQPIGVVTCAIIAAIFIPNYSCSPNFSEEHPLPSCYNVPTGEECCRKADNYGWRYLMYTLGAVSVTTFLLRTLVFRLRESPKYLVYRGRDKEAIEVLHYVATVNKTSCKITLDDFRTINEETEEREQVFRPMGSRTAQLTQTLRSELGRYRVLFSTTQMTRLTILVWLTYIFDYSGFTVAGTYLPRILALKNGALHLSLAYTYRAYLWTYTPGILGVALGAWTYGLPRVGRKYTMATASLLMGLCTLALSAAGSRLTVAATSAAAFFFQSTFNAVLYGWTPEAFPAPVRATACGLASFWGRLFAILSPVVAQRLYARSVEPGGDVNAVLYLAGGVTLGCVVTVALLPSKSLGERSL